MLPTARALNRRGGKSRWAARSGHEPDSVLGHVVLHNLGSESGRERPSAIARKPVSRVGEGGRHAPTPSFGACSSAVGAAQKAAPFRCCVVPRAISKLLSLSGFGRLLDSSWCGLVRVCPPPLATTGGDNSPPASCLPVCLPNSKIHDVPTKEERRRYGRASTCASKRPAPRVMASASAGELVASMTLPPSRNQAR